MTSNAGMPRSAGYQRILVATDFSSPSRAALRQAIWIARSSGAKIMLVHVLPDFGRTMHSASADAKLDLLYGEGVVFHQEVLGNSEHQLRAMIEEAAAPDVEIQGKTLLGQPFVEICRAVRQSNYDLVVAGTRGLPGWQSFFVGSTARRLIRKCPTSVWIVKEAHACTPKTLLVGVDMSEVSQRALTEAMRIARWSNADMHVLHVIDSGDVPESLLNKSSAGPPRILWQEQLKAAAESRFEAFLAQHLEDDVRIQKHLLWGLPSQEIGQLAKTLDEPLIVLGTVGHGELKGVLLGHTSEKVLATCDFSILTVKPADFVSPLE